MDEVIPQLIAETARVDLRSKWRTLLLLSLAELLGMAAWFSAWAVVRGMIAKVPHLVSVEEVK